MREIKFRGWTNSYYYGPRMYCNIAVQDSHSVYAKCYSGPDDSAFLEKDEDIIPMQYTGIKDKNGTDVYEGDIVQLYGGENAIIGHVIFKDGKFQIYVHKFATFQFFNSRSDYIEVIGNIYENPDLFKEREVK